MKYQKTIFFDHDKFGFIIVFKILGRFDEKYESYSGKTFLSFGGFWSAGTASGSEPEFCRRKSEDFVIFTKPRRL